MERNLGTKESDDYSRFLPFGSSSQNHSGRPADRPESRSTSDTGLWGVVPLAAGNGQWPIGANLRTDEGSRNLPSRPFGIS